MSDWIREAAEEWFAETRKVAENAGPLRDSAMSACDNAVDRLSAIIKSHLPTGEVRPTIADAIETVRDAVVTHRAMCGNALYCDCGAQVVKNEIIAELEALASSGEKK